MYYYIYMQINIPKLIQILQVLQFTADYVPHSLLMNWS